MSFLRHGEIYHCGEGAIPQDHALAHRNDESPAGYSSAGCSPAEPASASPASAIMLRWFSLAKVFAANGKLSLILLSQLRGAVHTKCLVAQTAVPAVCGFSMIAAASRGPQTRRSALRQDRGNKARMSMKTNSRGVEQSRSRESDPGSQAVGCRLLVTLRLSTLDFST